nr:MAG TPA: hypothetical protein [Caudoviricetes sp.]
MGNPQGIVQNGLALNDYSISWVIKPATEVRPKSRVGENPLNGSALTIFYIEDIV